MKFASISRRKFLERSGTGIAAGTLISTTAGSCTTGSSPPSGQENPSLVPRTEIAFTVNGQRHQLEVEDRWTLAEVLRDHLRFTGTKIGCDRGECGACTVLLEGRPTYSCSYLAVWADGKEVSTVEGLSSDGQLHTLQEAFVQGDGPQCGFCTSGQLMSASALLRDNPSPTKVEVRRALAGNLCRCSNYNRYVEAVVAASSAGEKL